MITIPEYPYFVLSSTYQCVRILPKTAHFSVRFATQSCVDVNYRRQGIFRSERIESVATDSEGFDYKQCSLPRCYLVLFYRADSN